MQLQNTNMSSTESVKERCKEHSDETKQAPKLRSTAEHKKTKSRTTICPITGTESQTQSSESDVGSSTHSVSDTN